MDYLSIHEIKPKHQGSKQMFKNPVLEKLTRSHISIPITTLFILSAWFIYLGTVRSALTMQLYVIYILIGVLSFTFFEYMMHRFLYHMIPTSNLKGMIQYNIHGVHHEFPNDKSRLAMPPVVIFIFAFVLLYAFRFLMGDIAYAFTPGFMIGYSGYLTVHYLVHAYQPPKNIFKSLWINHSIHHYKDPNAAFGVSSPLWDYVFQTIPKRKKR